MVQVPDTQQLEELTPYPRELSICATDAPMSDRQDQPKKQFRRQKNRKKRP
jgi:hypothetical protein